MHQYKITFTNGSFLVVEAREFKTNADNALFYDHGNNLVAAAPTERILHIQKLET